MTSSATTTTNNVNDESMISQSTAISLAASTRNAVLVIENRTAHTMIRKRVQQWHGTFHVDHLPSERIAAHSRALVATHSVGVLIGCEFSLSFTLADSSSALVDVYVCAPFIGAPFSSVSSLLQLGVECRTRFVFDSTRRLWLFFLVLIAPPSPVSLSVRWPGIDDPIALPQLEHRSRADLQPTTKGQMLIHVQDFVRDAQLLQPAADARSFVYAQLLRLRAVEPDDRLPAANVKLRDEATAAAYVGQHTTVTEPLYWSTPQYVAGDMPPLFNEVFVVNVDDLLRDGCVIKVIETTLFGAKQRVLAERRIMAAHVLPDAQRRTLIDSLADQLTRLQRLRSEYEVLYSAPTHVLERLKMKRDIDALEEVVQALDDAHRAVPREFGIAAAVRFVSTALSAPTDMQHSLHIGIDAQGRFTTRNISPEWERLFQKAGVLRNELDDAQTFAALVATIGDLAPLTANDMPHGVNLPGDSPSAKGVSPKHWLARRARVAATHALALDVSALNASSRPTDDDTVALLRRRRALLVAASTAACNAAERESDLAVAAAVAAKAAMYGRAADQALVLLGGSPRDHVESIDVDELEDEEGESLQSSFSENVINVGRLPNVPLLPPSFASNSPRAALPTSAVKLPAPPLPLPPPPLPVVVDDDSGGNIQQNATDDDDADDDAHAADDDSKTRAERQEHEPFEAARLSLLDQIRQGSVLRSHCDALPNLRQLPVTSESTLIDALHEAVIRRRSAMTASSELTKSAETVVLPPTKCDGCGEQLTHSELFQHECIKN